MRHGLLATSHFMGLAGAFARSYTVGSFSGAVHAWIKSKAAAPQFAREGGVRIIYMRL